MEDAKNHVLKHSDPVDNCYTSVQGINVDEVHSVADLVHAFKSCGIQATKLGQAADILREMYGWRLSKEPLTEAEQQELVENPALNKVSFDELQKSPLTDFSWAAPALRKKTRARIFLSFTSNMMTSGLRECFVYLAKHKLVDCFVTTAGGIEEDFIRVLGNFVIGDFHAIPGEILRNKGWNRAGNIYVPNENYVKFEKWIQPHLKEMLRMQTEQNYKWTPSKFIHFLGTKINDESSLYYWCAKYNIPVFCPGLTDGSIGDCLYFEYRSQSQRLNIDIVEDIIKINEMGRCSIKSGIIVLGGGLPKHHICNANLMRNGADYAIYINTAQEFDASDSGASPDEAISWGKIAQQAKYVKINCDASICFPILLTGMIKQFDTDDFDSCITQSFIHSASS